VHARRSLGWDVVANRSLDIYSRLGDAQ
jgi:hypothetical protein